MLVVFDIMEKLTKCFNGNFSHCDHYMALAGVTTMLPGVIDDLVKDIDVEYD